MRTVLQVPMSMDLRTAAAATADDLGFSSLQEAVRILMKKLAKRQLTVGIEEDAVSLSPAAEKRYLKMTKDFESGKNVYSAKNVDDLMRQLHAS